MHARSGLEVFGQLAVRVVDDVPAIETIGTAVDQNVAGIEVIGRGFVDQMGATAAVNAFDDPFNLGVVLDRTIWRVRHLRRRCLPVWLNADRGTPVGPRRWIP